MASPRSTVRSSRAASGSPSWRSFPQPATVKVPAILAVFWLIKVLTTAMGEATSDWFGEVSVPLGAVVEIGLVTSALWLQFRARHYRPLTYWYLAGSIAVFGTGVADATHQVGLSYSVASAGWAIVLAVVFWRWHRSEGTLSIHSITTTRREVYYWCTVFATFALGTALGDWTALVLNLGFLASGCIFAGIILLPLVAWWKLGLDSVVAFWAAYVVTRPLGASFADYFSKSKADGGIGVGGLPTAAVLAVAVIAGVAYLAVTGVDRQSPEHRGGAGDELVEPLA